jgi:hypothetical protein
MIEKELMEPYAIDATCPSCQATQVFAVDFIAGCMFPLPDVFVIECKRCGQTSRGFQTGHGWKIAWDQSNECVT